MHSLYKIKKLYTKGSDKMEINKNLETNIDNLDKIFGESDDISKRLFPVGMYNLTKAYIIYIDNLANSDFISKTVVTSLMFNIRLVKPSCFSSKDVFTALINGGITAPDIREEKDFNNVVIAIQSGDTALFLDGHDFALIIASRGWQSRGVPTAETEVVLQGSKEAFSESMRTNTVLIRRRIRDNNLVIRQTQLGRRSRTDIAIAYIKDIVRPDVLNEVQQRLDKIDIDAILDIGYIEQLIEDDWKSPFPQCQITERPDKVASSLLEGKIAIISDNAPFALIVPSVITCFFQSPEDYYGRFEIMSLSRLLRYLGCVVAITLPGLYLAIALYNPNMIPTEIMFRMAEARQTVPFPALVEIMIMDTAFELLREAGIRLPSAIGSTIGVVGGIIIGQAAVEAGFVSPIVVIIVALTAICGFTLPNVSLVGGIRISKYLLILGGAFFGLIGFWVGLIFILIHLASLKSFGFPYLFPFVSSDINGYSDLKDTLVRPPLFWMNKRPFFANEDQRKRNGLYR